MMRNVGLRGILTWLMLAIRLLLGGTWLYAGISKVTHLDESVGAVFAFRLIPDGPAKVIGGAIPFVEIAVGGLLIIGLWTRLAAIAGTGLSVMFLIAIISAAVRGLRIDCGCFGGGGDLAATDNTKYTLDIVRDSAMLLGSVLLACWPVSKLAADNYDVGEFDGKEEKEIDEIEQHQK